MRGSIRRHPDCLLRHQAPVGGAWVLAEGYIFRVHEEAVVEIGCA